jgi:4-hydroxybenzoate polyprenyltransferase
MLAVLGAFGWFAHLGLVFYLSLLLIAGAVLYEHRSAARLDVMGINRAFFTSNAVVGLVFVLGIFVDQVLFKYP